MNTKKQEIKELDIRWYNQTVNGTEVARFTLELAEKLNEVIAAVNELRKG